MLFHPIVELLDLFLLRRDDALRHLAQLRIFAGRELGLRHFDRSLVMYLHHRRKIAIGVSGQRHLLHALHHPRHRLLHGH